MAQQLPGTKWGTVVGSDLESEKVSDAARWLDGGSLGVDWGEMAAGLG